MKGQKKEPWRIVVTTITVSLVKVGVITGGILLIKWIIGKFRK